MKISDIVNDGNLYSFRGVEIDFDAKTIYTVPSHSRVKITMEHLERVYECIDYNLEDIIDELEYKKERLNQRKDLIIPIENGYKIRKPLSEYLTVEYTKRVSELEDIKNFLESVNDEFLLS